MRALVQQGSFRRKVMAIMMLTVAFALTTAIVVLFAWDLRVYRAHVVRDVGALASVIADNSTAAASFLDERAALETLSSLRVKPHIDVVCTYDLTGRVLARFGQKDMPCPPLSSVRTDEDSWRYVTLHRPIERDGKGFGTLYIRRNLDDVTGQVALQGVTALMVLAAAMLVGFMLSRRLQRGIVEPIEHVASVARDVSVRRDYSVRATRHGNDEIGALVDALNAMLEQIQTRDTELQSTKTQLEETVRHLRDEILQRERIELERVDLLRREREANRVKDEFLATLSHELRTPLNAVLGWARMLQSGNMDAATKLRAVDAIERNARAQVRLVDDLLDVSRILAAKLRLEVRPVDWTAVVQSAVDVVRPAAEAKQVAIHARVAAPSEPYAGDPDRLQQLVWNLLSNAVKFTPPHGSVWIELCAGRDIELTVTDSGIGIAPEFLPRVFEQFKQADSSSTREQGGLGLGLTLVKQIAELHGGTVAIESEGLNRGTTVRVTLPMQVFGDPRARHGVPQPEHAASLAGIRVVVVDDDPDSLELMTRALTGSGAEVASAKSVEDAMQAIGRMRPHVVVSDIAMPGQDGYALLRRIHTSPPDEDQRLITIAVSAYAEPSAQPRPDSPRFDLHLTKPVDLQELSSIVSRLARSEQLSGDR